MENSCNCQTCKIISGRFSFYSDLIKAEVFTSQQHSIFFFFFWKGITWNRIYQNSFVYRTKMYSSRTNWYSCIFYAFQHSRWHIRVFDISHQIEIWWFCTKWQVKLPSIKGNINNAKEKTGWFCWCLYLENVSKLLHEKVIKEQPKKCWKSIIEVFLIVD